LLCAAPFPSSAQDAVLDSIRQSIEALPQDDTTRVQRYLDLASVAQGRGKPAGIVAAIQACVRTAEAQGRPFGRAKALVASGSLQLMQGAIETGVADIRKGISVYRGLGEKRQEARALFILGGRLNRVGRCDEALKALKESESIYTRLDDSTALWDAWNVIGAVFHDKGMMKEASTYFARCLGIAEAKQQKSQVATSLINLANTLADRENERAISYYRRGIKAFKEMGDFPAQVTALQALGSTLRMAGKLDEARSTLEEALTLFHYEIDYAIRLGVLNSLSNTYTELGMKDLAMKTRQEHLSISRKLKDPLQVAMSLVNVANELNQIGNFAEAESNLLEACKLFEARGEKMRLISAYRGLVTCYEGRGDSLRAYAAFRRQTAIENEILGVNAQKHIDELAAKYDADHRENEIARLEQEKQIQTLSLHNRESELTRQRLLTEERQQAIRLLNQENRISELELGKSRSELALQKTEGEKKTRELDLLKTREDLQASVIDKRVTERNALIAGLVLLTLITFLAIRRIQDRRRQAALRADAAEAESLRVAARSAQREQEAQQLYTRRLIQSQEAERKRIAQELHDSLSQGLLVIRNRAMMGLREEVGAEKARQQLTVISDMAAQSIDEVRAISRDLRPSQLDRLGLTETIRGTLDSVAAASDIRFTTEVAHIDDCFTGDDAIGVYRVVQEAVNNILKHSAASEALVNVTRNDGTVRILIMDNGRGFDAHAVDSAPGLGLRGMQERVQMLQGNLELNAVPDRGATVSVVLPVICQGSEQISDIDAEQRT
jgi:signal transduction histidine kinase